MLILSSEIPNVLASQWDTAVRMLLSLLPELFSNVPCLAVSLAFRKMLLENVLYAWPCKPGNNISNAKKQLQIFVPRRLCCPTWPGFMPFITGRKESVKLPHAFIALRHCSKRKLPLWVIFSSTPIISTRFVLLYPDTSNAKMLNGCCLLYTSDAADEEDSVDLGGRRIIK